VLDLGCGCGSVALQLLRFFEGRGGYTGIDVDRQAIAWARRTLTPRDPRVRFVLADVANTFYNPAGAEHAATYALPVDDRSFDLALAKSLFTHMRPDELENYVRELGRVLRRGGHAVLTFFLLSAEREELTRRGKSPEFRFGSGVWRYADERMPEGAIAYDETYIRGLLETNRLELARPILRAHQDVVVVRAA
jgi:SAM-dependent methyltransferase